MKKRKPRACPAITIVIEEKLWRRRRAALALLRRSAALVLTEAKHARARDVTILLADDARLRALNHEFRGKNRPTNVLSFPGEPPYLGDIALGYGTIAREARAQRKSFAAHAAHLAAHGVLHLLGYDHQSDGDAARMEAREVALMAKLGLSDPYAAKGKGA
jgi:probable rRNA maturation factor